MINHSIFNRPLRLCPTYQTYHWGMKGTDSLVARLLKNIDPDQYYAELWVGSHKKSPSVVNQEDLNSCGCSIPQFAGIQLDLEQLIAAYPAGILGNACLEKFGAQLPFLFKILSIGKALSIQAHPDKSLALKLHSKDYKNYPDNNHKPEIAIALSELELLYGFISPSSIPSLINEFPGLLEFFNHDLQTRLISKSINSDNKILADIYRYVLEAEDDSVALSLNKIYGQLLLVTNPSPQQKLFMSLYEQFGPSDSGVISALFMNYEKVSSGDAIFIAPNILHAYISGELAECMANSDNVIRAGLTPKFKDKKVLLNMLDFVPTKLAIIRPTTTSKDKWIEIYKTPAEEFRIERIRNENAVIEVSCHDSPALYFCYEGKIEFFSEGEFEVTIGKGEAVLIPSELKKYVLKINKADLFKITIP